jgi:hypothetical protein
MEVYMRREAGSEAPQVEAVSLVWAYICARFFALMAAIWRHQVSLESMIRHRMYTDGLGSRVKLRRWSGVVGVLLCFIRWTRVYFLGGKLSTVHVTPPHTAFKKDLKRLTSLFWAFTIGKGIDIINKTNSRSREIIGDADFDKVSIVEDEFNRR